MSKKNRFNDSFKRQEPTIEPKPTGLALSPAWDYELPIKLFSNNMEEIKNILENEDNEEIYRYAVILISASLDKYIHDIMKVLLISIFNDQIPEGKTFDDFLVPMSALKQFEKNTFNVKQKNQILTQIIYDRTSQLTMQKSYAIERNLNHCLRDNIFKLILPTISRNFPEIRSQADLKSEIDSFSERRNKIAHELDYFPNSHKRIEISKDYVDRCYSFIDAVVKAIDKEVKRLIAR